MNDVYELEPIVNTDEKKNKAKLIWLITITFLLVNVFMIGYGLFGIGVADKITNLIDIIFWFDISCAGIIGSYFGVDIASQFTRKTNVTMKKVE